VARDSNEEIQPFAEQDGHGGIGLGEVLRSEDGLLDHGPGKVVSPSLLARAF
jgi:hypothetical protein